MDLEVEDSIDFDFFDTNPRSQNEDVRPSSQNVSASKPPVVRRTTKPLPKTNNIVNDSYKESGNGDRRPGSPSGPGVSKDYSSESSGSDTENSIKSLSEHKDDTKSQISSSRSPSSTSSISSSFSSSSLLSDSEISNSNLDSQSKSKSSDMTKGNRSRCSIGSDGGNRPINPLAKPEKQTSRRKSKSQQVNAEDGSSTYSDSDDSKSKKSSTLCDDNGDSNWASENLGKRQAWNEVKVTRGNEERSKSIKPSKTFSTDRPKTATLRRSKISYRTRSQRSHSESATLSDSDITDVSPIETPRNDAKDKSKDKRGGSSRMTSAGDGRPVKIQFRSVIDVDQKDGAIDNDYDPDKIIGLDLKILMKAVGELEKQKRVQANSRRVMFAPATLKSVEKDNYTFGRNQTRDIERENHRLLKEIVRQVNSGEQRKQLFRPPSSYKLTPSAINREREIQRIERENLAFLKRLQEVKPTKSICRDDQLRAYESTVFHGVPIAALHHKPNGRRSRNYVVDDSNISVGGHARSVSSISSTGSTSHSVGSSRHSIAIRQRSDSRPAWSDRW